MLNKKVLYFTNLFPFFDDLQGGSFLTNRLKKMKSIGLSFKVYGIISDDTVLVKMLKKEVEKKFTILPIPILKQKELIMNIFPLKGIFLTFSKKDYKEKKLF